MENNRYKNGKIFKLISSKTGEVYYGSTIEPTLAKRLAQIVSAYKQYIKGGRYISSFKIIETNDYEISLVESYPCNNRDELKMREKHYIDNNDCINAYKERLEIKRIEANLLHDHGVKFKDIKSIKNVFLN